MGAYGRTTGEDSSGGGRQEQREDRCRGRAGAGGRQEQRDGKTEGGGLKREGWSGFGIG